MKRILLLVFILASLSIHAQYNFSASSLPSVSHGFETWITINSATNEQGILIGGMSPVIDDDPTTSYEKTLKLFVQDGHSNWVMKQSFTTKSEMPKSAFFYKDNYVYIAFIHGSGVTIYRALMDGNADFENIYINFDLSYNRGTITAIDIDDDGYDDFLFSGYPTYSNGSTPEIGVIKNNTDGTFSLVAAPANIPIVQEGYFESGYFDASGKKHLLVISDHGNTVYRNEGNGVFTQAFIFEDSPKIRKVAIKDFDKDGLNDISITVYDGIRNYYTKLYKNLGDLDFQLYDSDYTGLPKVDFGIDYTDINNDGYMDALIITKAAGINNGIKVVLGSDNFRFFGEEITLTGENGNPIYASSENISIKDYNNDNMPDILFTGGQTRVLTNISTLLSVYDVELDGIILYPNPTNDIITIRGKTNIEEASLYNLKGQKIDIKLENNQISLKDKASGIYYLQLKTVNGIVTKKIMRH